MIEFTPQEVEHAAEQRAKKHNGFFTGLIIDKETTRCGFKCQQGHTWSIPKIQLRNPGWCQECGHQRTTKSHIYTIEKMHAIAQKKGLIFLSTEYKGSFVNHDWKCPQGHVFSAKPANVKYRTGCPLCFRLRQSTRQRRPWKTIVDNAKSHGLTILSDSSVFKNRFCTIHVRCEKNNAHEYDTTIASIDVGNGCRFCNVGGTSSPYTLVDIKKKVKGFATVLSTEFKNLNTPATLRCHKNGHVFTTKCEYLMQGNTCPKCMYKTEEYVRSLFEKITKREFPRKRMWEWGRLELDGYCKELSIAFEYNSKYHYAPHELFHTKRTLEEVQQRDEKKKQLCEENNIKLIIIPDIPVDKMEHLVREELARVGIN